jgi:hypothetical protein
MIRKIANSFHKLGLPNFRNHKIVPKILRFVRLSGIRIFFSGASVKKIYYAMVIWGYSSASVSFWCLEFTLVPQGYSGASGPLKSIEIDLALRGHSDVLGTTPVL